MDGMYNSSIKKKMDELEMEKQTLIDKITFMEKQKELLKIPTREFLRDMFKHDMDIKNKSTEDKKRIIAKYVKKVIVREGLCKTYLDLNMQHAFRNA